jgi:bifunctional UDP-N-acetylglucosamine pyrophosphorylase / glucosamine-1-phosphate N-acetyltransferase
MNHTVVILAAGLGTRMRSKRAKVLHRAGGLALIEQVVAAARTLAPYGRIVVVTGYQAEVVEELLRPLGIGFARQERQEGTGHALAACREIAPYDGLLTVLYGDTPLLTAATLARLRDAQTDSDAAATLITTTLQDPTGYGRILRDEKGDVTAIVEERAATAEQKKFTLINSGIYCFRSERLWKHIAEIEPNPATGELFLTDMAEILTRHGYRNCWGSTRGSSWRRPTGSCAAVRMKS